MNKNTGHVVRIIGIAIEMLGVSGVLRSTSAKDQTRLPLPGGPAVPLAMVAVGLGFVLWFTGTILVYTLRGHRKTRSIDEP